MRKLELIRLDSFTVLPSSSLFCSAGVGSSEFLDGLGTNLVLGLLVLSCFFLVVVSGKRRLFSSSDGRSLGFNPSLCLNRSPRDLGLNDVVVLVVDLGVVLSVNKLSLVVADGLGVVGPSSFSF